MKFSCYFNEEPYKEFICECYRIWKDMKFTTENKYLVGKGTLFPVVVTTDVVEPLMEATKKMALAAVALISHTKAVEKDMKDEVKRFRDGKDIKIN